MLVAAGTIVKILLYFLKPIRTPAVCILFGNSVGWTSKSKARHISTLTRAMKNPRESGDFTLKKIKRQSKY
jgi:hypothetical protein